MTQIFPAPTGRLPTAEVGCYGRAVRQADGGPKMQRRPWLAATLALTAGLGTLALSAPAAAGTITCFGKIPTIVGTDG